MIELENISYILEDFTKINTGGWDNYVLNKDCIIFNQLFKKENFELDTRLDSNENITDFIPKINIFLQWIGGLCKNELIDAFCEIVSSWNEDININSIQIINSKWYEELKIYHVTLFLSEGGVLCSRIICNDNYNKNDILEINIIEKNIEIKYDEARFYKLYKISENEDFIKAFIENECENDCKEDILDFCDDNNEIRKKINFCNIHKCIMEKEQIPIMYGLPIGPIVGYTEAREKLFPNCDDILLGGCCVSEESEKFDLLYVCKHCNQVRDEWKMKHKSEICFNLNKNVKENIIIILNQNENILLKKDYSYENYWVKVVSIPNGKYKIFAKEKITGNIITSIDVELNNEYLKLAIEKSINDIDFNILYKDKVDALWY
jgi:hypothetical protein